MVRAANVLAVLIGLADRFFFAMIRAEGLRGQCLQL